MIDVCSIYIYTYIYIYNASLGILLHLAFASVGTGQVVPGTKSEPCHPDPGSGMRSPLPISAWDSAPSSYFVPLFSEVAAEACSSMVFMVASTSPGHSCRISASQQNQVATTGSTEPARFFCPCSEGFLASELDATAESQSSTVIVEKHAVIRYRLFQLRYTDLHNLHNS